MLKDAIETKMEKKKLTRVNPPNCDPGHKTTIAS